MECYNFCQQCEDYFAIARFKKVNQILFATFFLQDWISFCWQKYKWEKDANSFVPVIRDVFKAFFC